MNIRAFYGEAKTQDFWFKIYGWVVADTEDEARRLSDAKMTEHGWRLTEALNQTRGGFHREIKSNGLVCFAVLLRAHVDRFLISRQKDSSRVA